MAGTIRYIHKLSMNLSNKIIGQQLFYNASRTLYDEASLGLDTYKVTRNIVFEKYKVGLEAFKSKMCESINDEKAMVFTEDLKSTLHLVEKDPNDIQLVVGMLIKFNSQNSQVRFGTFKFGPVVMRAFYYLNEPEVALKLFADPKFDEFFNQMSSFMLLMDLLYENKRYADLRTVYDKIRQKFVGGISHPKLVINIIAMSCYKENSEKSLEYGLRICKDLDDRGSIPLRKVISALSALALNLNKPQVSLELVSLSRTTDYISIRCIRIMALADLDRIDDIIIEIKQIIRRGFAEKSGFYSDTVERIQAAAKRLELSEDHEIFKLLNILQSKNYIEPMTLDKHLSQPLKTQSKENEPMVKKYRSSSWSDLHSESANSDKHRVSHNLS